MQRVLVFDIETGPLSLERLKTLHKPPKPDAKLVESAKPFDPESVKYGLLKDEAKRAEKLKTNREKWEAAQQEAIAKLGANCHEALAEFIDKAPLSSLTGRVVAIGYRHGTSHRIEAINRATATEQDRDAEESGIISAFWSRASRAMDQNLPICGHNICGFDLPFLIQRSWMLGVAVPKGLLKNNRYWHDCFVDTMVRFSCGKYGSFTSLDTLARAMAIGGKPEDCTGGDFHRLWFGTPEQNATAEKYLRNDLDMTYAVAERMGVA